ncbi:MAG TPA: tRNA (adenosine(37)-N6)-threonylcarbamoyltransferase complex ATPase subunit type 1 TsaE [Trichormus sp.]|jgi:tRNA threonylcarbamoyladenosine biosynthesis protein TsaE
MNEIFRVRLPDRDATRQFARALADAIEDRAVVALIGPMGAGKTTLVQDVAAALGVKELVNSPTFTMLNEYHSGRLPLYHLDLYRLSEQDGAGAADLLLAELDEFIHSSMVAMIEWAELISIFQRPSSAVSPLGDQLDYLVVRLSPESFAETQHLTGQTGNSLPTDRSVDQNDINKDEEVRFAELRPIGRDSEALAARLRCAVTAMLIYS